MRKMPAQQRHPKAMRMPVHALLVGERLDTRALERESVLAAAPLTIRAGKRGYGVLFRYGAVVLFDLSPAEEAEFLATLTPLTVRPLAAPETEEMGLTVDAGAEERVDLSGDVFVTALAPERLQIIADVLAKSVVLGHYESKLDAVFDRIEPLAVVLQRGGRGGSQANGLLREIGEVLLTEHKMVGHVEVLEKPDVLWEHPELERFHVRLRDEYELRERERAVNRKLELISRTVATLLELIQNKRSLRVEWYIVLLIVFEIVLTLYDMVLA
jgi:required for meiotic nuclear division protein 1